MAEGWQPHVTSELRCVVDVAALQAYAQTVQAESVPVNKHGVSYGSSERQLIRSFLRHVDVAVGDTRFGTVHVRYWYGKCGSALVDAGLVCTSREVPVPPDWQRDPFSLPKRLRSLALGAFDDIDDNGAHPHARLNMVQPGAGVVRQFLDATNRDQVLYGLGGRFFPQVSAGEGRGRVKLFRWIGNIQLVGGSTVRCGSQRRWRWRKRRSCALVWHRARDAWMRDAA